MKQEPCDGTVVSMLSERADDSLVFCRGLLEALTDQCRSRLPDQGYGVLLGLRRGVCGSFRFLCSNLRNIAPDIRRRFASFGEFHADPRRGFWVDPTEQHELLQELERSGEEITGYFHVHRDAGPLPTDVDRQLHFDRDAPVVILSLSADGPEEVRAFVLGDRQWREIRIEEDRAGND